MNEFSPEDAKLIRMVAYWVKSEQTPSLLPISLSRQLNAIADSIERVRAKEALSKQKIAVDRK